MTLWQYPVFLAMLIKNLSYDCNKVSSFLNSFRVFRYLNIYVPKGVRPNPLNPPSPSPPPLLRVWIHLQNKCARYSRSRIYGGPQLSRPNQILHGKSKIAFGFCRGYLLLPWGIWFLLWSIWFCREVFGFAVRVLSWGILFLPWGFWFWRDSWGPP